jgi:hypothetical protein
VGAGDIHGWEQEEYQNQRADCCQATADAAQSIHDWRLRESRAERQAKECSPRAAARALVHDHGSRITRYAPASRLLLQRSDFLFQPFHE